MSIFNIVSISGGKDSTALWLLALERGVENIKPVFADTGNEHPETYAYVDYLERELGEVTRVKASFDKQMAKKREFVLTKWEGRGVPQQRIDSAAANLNPTGNPFLDMVKWKGRFPSTKARFCTEELKVLPIMRQVTMPLLKEGHEIISWQGVRADESPSRAKLPESDIDDLGVTNYRPILKWTVEDVFAMHDKYGIEPNPLYKQGVGRVGCMPCVNCNKAELAEIAKRFPDEITRIADWEAEASKTGKLGSATFFHAPEDNPHYTTHGIRHRVEWAKTAHGGKQMDWVSSVDMPTCMSKYGLCE